MSPVLTVNAVDTKITSYSVLTLCRMVNL